MAEAYLILRRRRKLLRVCGHRRVEVLNGYAEILGETEDLGLFKFIKLSLELYELVPGVLENAAFSLGGGGGCTGPMFMDATMGPAAPL